MINYLHVNNNLYQNTNTVLFIETNLYKHNKEHFLFWFQKGDFFVAWEVPWVWQTRVLIEQEENSPCLPPRPTQCGSQLILPSINRQMSLEKRGCLCLVWKKPPCPIVNLPSWTLCLWDRRLDSCLYPSLEPPHWRVLSLSSSLFPLGGSNWYSR